MARSEAWFRKRGAVKFQYRTRNTAPRCRVIFIKIESIGAEPNPQ